jgi:hypothetical protein
MIEILVTEKLKLKELRLKATVTGMISLLPSELLPTKDSDSVFRFVGETAARSAV